MRPIRWAAVLLGAAVLAVSACSSSATSGGTASGSAAATNKASGSPYKIGVICSCSGSNAASLTLMTNIVFAWA